MRIIFGTRGSALALAQTEHTVNRVRTLYPEVNASILTIRTTGDRRTDVPLAAIGGFGAFTREIEQSLLSGEIDAAVHSLKDLPIRQPDELYVVAIAERESPGDVLVSRNGLTLETLPPGACVGTSSLRRSVQLLLARPDLSIEEIRGNVPTRLGKVTAGDLDAVVIAKAGLFRLGLQHDHRFWEIPPEIMLPAPGQGALAIEIRRQDTDLASLLSPLHDPRAAAEVNCERAILKGFGGGCRSPLGARAQCQNNLLHVTAMAGNPDSGCVSRLAGSGNIENAEALGEEIGNTLRKEVGEC